MKEKEEFKKEVLDWLSKSGLVPKKVRVYNTRRYGLEVRAYCEPMIFVSNRVSFRTTSIEKVGENGIRRHGTRGFHERKIPMYISINKENMIDEEGKFTLQMIKDSCILK
jgi:hypothetical protein